MATLELLLPAGRAGAVRVLGSRAVRGAPSGDCEGAVDLVVLAPTGAECRDADGLRRLVGLGVETLVPDGLLYLAAPVRHRARLARLVTGKGLVRRAAYAHLPGLGEARFLVPLEARPARDALACHVALWPKRQRLLAHALRTSPGRRATALLLPAAGVAFGRPSAPPPFTWLQRAVFGVADGEPVPPPIHLGASLDRAVLHAFGGTGLRAEAIVKVALAPGVDLEREREALIRLGPDGRAAGAEIPSPLDPRAETPLPALLLTPLHGRAAPLVLATEPKRLEPCLELLTDWLARWHERTAVVETLSEESLREAMLGSLDPLAHHLPDVEGYRQWLLEHCRRAAGTDVPLPAAHHDLTMWNVLLGEGTLGVLDWGAAGRAPLPLGDFFYAAVDAVAAADRYRDRVGAFRDCYGAEGRQRGLIARLRGRLLPGFEPSRELEALCLHACWLRHALDEERKPDVARTGEFVAIARLLASERSRLETGRRA